MFKDFNFEEFYANMPHKFFVDNVYKDDTSRTPEYRICRLKDLKYSIESWDSKIQADNTRRLGEFNIYEG